MATQQTTSFTVNKGSGSGQGTAAKVAGSKNLGNRTGQTYSSSDKGASEAAKQGAAKRSSDRNRAANEPVNTVAQQSTETNSQTPAVQPIASSVVKGEVILQDTATKEVYYPVASGYNAPNAGTEKTTFYQGFQSNNPYYVAPKKQEAPKVLPKPFVSQVQPAPERTEPRFITQVKGQAQLAARGFLNAAGFRADTQEDTALFKQRTGTATFGGSTAYELGGYAGAIAKPFTYVGAVKSLKLIPTPFKSGIANAVLGAGVVTGTTYGYSQVRNTASDKYSGLTTKQIYEVGRESGGNTFQQIFPFLQSERSFTSKAQNVLIKKGYATSEAEARELAGVVAERYKGSFLKPLSPTPVDTLGAVGYNRVTEAGGRLAFTNAFSRLEKQGVSLSQPAIRFGKTLTPKAKLFNLGAGVIGAQGVVEGSAEYLNYKTFRGESPTASGLAYSAVGGSFIAGTIGGAIVASPFIKSGTIRKAIGFTEQTVNVLDPAEKPGDLVQDAVEATALKKGKVVFSAETSSVGSDVFPVVVGRYGTDKVVRFSTRTPFSTQGFSFTPSSTTNTAASSRQAPPQPFKTTTTVRTDTRVSPRSVAPVRVSTPSFSLVKTDIKTSVDIPVKSPSPLATKNFALSTSVKSSLPATVTNPTSVKNPVPTSIKNPVSVPVKVVTGFGLPFIPPSGGFGKFNFRGKGGRRAKNAYTPSLVGIEARKITGSSKSSGYSGLEVRGITKKQLALIEGKGKSFVRFF